LRAHGQRPQAFEQLNRFLAQFPTHPLDFRIWFVREVLEHAESIPDADDGPLPHPLKELAVKPTLRLWSEQAPDDPLPLYWLARFFQDRDALRMALERNPSYQAALTLDIRWKLTRLDFSTHHLPESYVGNMDTDLALIEFIEASLPRIQDTAIRQDLQADFHHFRTLVRNFHLWQTTGEGHFADWAMDHGYTAESATRTYPFDP
jgi:hypothetical protein